MKRIIHNNWSIQLMSTLLKGQFFIAPEQAAALGGTVHSLLARDLTEFSSKTAEEVELEDTFPLQVVSSNNGVNIFHSNLDEAPVGSTAIIPIKGTMLKYGTLCSYGTEEIGEAIRYAANHNSIDSIVLDIDSGGGSISSIAPIIEMVEYAKSLNIPVIASVDTACSAAYWAAASCDYIIANNEISSVVGSIGVVFNFQDIRGYYESKGYKFHTVYAAESTHKNLPFQNALDGDYTLLKEEELSPLAIKFQNAIKEMRAGKIDLSVEGILNGKTFYAPQALSAGLIDEVGNNMTALERARNLAEVQQLINQFN